MQKKVKNNDSKEFLSRKHPWFKSIVFKTALLSWLLILFTLTAYVLAILPYQKEVAIDRMKSEAKDIATSIAQVTATAIITEEYVFSVEHCLRVVKESKSILYLVITKYDGFSLIHTQAGWRQDTLKGIWNPDVRGSAEGKFIHSDLIGEDVFHYSYPFTYSGIEWGWIHIGLSLKTFNKVISSMYLRTIWLAAALILIGLVASLYFSRKLVKPLSMLDAVTRKVATGDLTTRADIDTGDELESLAHSFNKMTETIKQSREDLIAAHEYLYNVIRSIATSLIVVNPDFTIKSVNQNTIDMLGYTENELIGMDIHTIIEEEEIKGFGINNLIRKGFIKNVEKIYLSKNGTKISVSFSGAVIYNNNEAILGIVCLAQDISERKRAEEEIIKAHDMLEIRVNERTAELAEINKALELEIAERKQAEEKIRASLQEKEVLLKEIHHRVKNNLQVISSLLYLNSRKITDNEVMRMFQESQNRVKSIALVHERLYQSKDLARIEISDYLKRLTNDLYRSYGVNSTQIKLTLNVEDVSVSIDNAVPCGLIVNELISNSLKYAFPGGMPGEIYVGFRSIENGEFELKVKDNGRGISEEIDLNNLESLGLQLVNILVKQLDGNLELDRNGGTSFTITFNESKLNTDARLNGVNRK